MKSPEGCKVDLCHTHTCVPLVASSDIQPVRPVRDHSSRSDSSSNITCVEGEPSRTIPVRNAVPIGRPVMAHYPVAEATSFSSISPSMCNQMSYFPYPSGRAVVQWNTTKYLPIKPRTCPACSGRHTTKSRVQKADQVHPPPSQQPKAPTASSAQGACKSTHHEEESLSAAITIAPNPAHELASLA